MTVVILVDDNACDGFAAEHGLSVWIEFEDRRILFDTGQGITLEENARRCGVDIDTTEIVVLSHGHYDHTGGIANVIQRAPTADVCCHPGVMWPRYSVENRTPRPVHMPHESRHALAGLPAERHRWATRPMLLSPRVGITGPIPRTTSFEDTGGPFYLDPAGTRVDTIEDDSALWIRTDDGVVVCLGCSHAGAVNTLACIQRLTAGQRIRAVIGGMHLRSAGPERLRQTIAAMQRLEPDVLVPSHCTGEGATAAFRDAFGERVIPGAAGMTLQL